MSYSEDYSDDDSFLPEEVIENIEEQDNFDNLLDLLNEIRNNSNLSHFEWVSSVDIIKSLKEGHIYTRKKDVNYLTDYDYQHYQDLIKHITDAEVGYNGIQNLHYTLKYKNKYYAHPNKDYGRMY